MITIEIHEETATREDMADALERIAELLRQGYVRSGPPVQMQDVLLACGELNKRERVAVQWALDKINELPDHPKEQGAEPVDPASPYDDKRLVQHLLNSLDWMYRSLSWSVARDRGFDGAFVNAGQMIYEAKRSGYFPKHQYGVALNPPTPTAREKALEEAGEEVIRAYRNFHEAIKQDTGRPYPWEPMVSAIEDWMAAKSTK